MKAAIPHSLRRFQPRLTPNTKLVIALSLLVLGLISPALASASIFLSSVNKRTNLTLQSLRFFVTGLWNPKPVDTVHSTLQIEKATLASRGIGFDVELSFLISQFGYFSFQRLEIQADMPTFNNPSALYAVAAQKVVEFEGSTAVQFLLKFNKTMCKDAKFCSEAYDALPKVARLHYSFVDVVNSTRFTLTQPLDIGT